jgi:hypothetical protein
MSADLKHGWLVALQSQDGVASGKIMLRAPLLRNCIGYIQPCSDCFEVITKKNPTSWRLDYQMVETVCGDRMHLQGQEYWMSQHRRDNSGIHVASLLEET